MLREKLKSSRGFTLAELLMVILILVMAGSIVVAGIPVAMRAYEKVVDSANAQLLLSTTVSSLRRELSLASEVEIDAEGLHYTNGETGMKYTLQNRNGVGIVRMWEATEGGSPTENDELLISREAASVDKSGNHVTQRLVSSCKWENTTYSNGVFQIYGLSIENKDGHVLAALDDGNKPLVIRSIMGAE